MRRDFSDPMVYVAGYRAGAAWTAGRATDDHLIHLELLVCDKDDWREFLRGRKSLYTVGERLAIYLAEDHTHDRDAAARFFQPFVDEREYENPEFFEGFVVGALAAWGEKPTQLRLRAPRKRRLDRQ